MLTAPSHCFPLLARGCRQAAAHHRSSGGTRLMQDFSSSATSRGDFYQGRGVSCGRSVCI